MHNVLAGHLEKNAQAVKGLTSRSEYVSRNFH